MATQEERKELTQKRIIRAARVVFARDGFAKASLFEVVKKSGVTTGAIYHHFTDKKGLFTAVAEDLEKEIIREASKTTRKSGTYWERFESNVTQTLEVCARPDIQRIVFREAPTVVGLHEWKKIEQKYGFGLLQKSIGEFAKEGIIKTLNPDLTAQILLGAIMEAAHAAALAKNKKKVLKEGQAIVLAFLRALKS